MKRTLAVLVVSSVMMLFASTSIMAQPSTPQIIKVQGYLSQNSGGTITPVYGPVTMTFALWDADASTGGTLIGSAGPMTVDVTNGLYEVDLPFALADFSGPNRYLEASVNGQVQSPRLHLASAPFAYQAENLGGFTGADFVKKSGDSMTGPLQVAGSIYSTTGGFRFPDGTIQTTAGGGGGTLDQAYNFGGPGAGRTINANSGAVNIAGIGGLTVNKQLTVTGSATSGNAGSYQAVVTDGTRSLSLGATPSAGELQSTGAVPLRVNPAGNDVFFFSNVPASLDVRGSITGHTGSGYSVIGQASGTAYAGLFRYGTDGNNAAYLGGNGNAALFYGPIAVSGQATVGVLQITGGSDLSEPFAMSSRNIPEGAVVIIDPEHAGDLMLSDHSYDTRVAGVVSGANGIKPGISMRQDGVLPEGKNVALSGRVYALADASYGEIRPGDLLTTSETPGHCMKVSDHAAGQGAIIGKAMSGLETGQGMVLVLVTLQ